MSVIYTIGYEGKTAEHVISKLVEAKLSCLLDVRRNPVSRKPGLSKTKLAFSCQQHGIIYIHIPELGISSADRKGLNGRASYERLLDRYEKEMLPTQKDSFNRVVELVQEQKCALLCFEADPSLCHRGRLARKVAMKTPLSVAHL